MDAAPRFTLIALLLSFAGHAGAAVPEEERVAWLKKHVAPWRSIDPTEEDFSDLEPIRKAIGAARIVQLSEQSHGDGATFHARTRLIKFLHQKCGFDVLAFESGLYDCRKAWQLLREGRMPPRQAIEQGVFGIWTGSAQVQPLLEYLGQQARGPRPLELCGFDSQFTGPASRRHLPTDLDVVLSQLPTEALSSEQRGAVLKGCKRLAGAGTGIDKEQLEAFAVCRKALADMKPTGALPVTELAFWRQFLDSATGQADVEAAAKEKPFRIERYYGSLRDAQMAQNLTWLAREAYPRRKIIVWAACYHLLRNQDTVAVVTEVGKTPAERKTTFPYTKIRTMGNDAWKALGKETYSLFFTAAEGEFQSFAMPKPLQLAAVVPGSLEDLFLKAGCENAFVDLRSRGANGKWLEERLIARPLGHADYEADWTRVCDGLVFTRKMYRSTPARAPGTEKSVEGQYQPVRDPVDPGGSFDRYTTKDAFGRTITFYLTKAPKGSTEKRPLAVFIQGSGCASVFARKDGKTMKGLVDLVAAAGKGNLCVMVVEKPGVRFGDLPKEPGSAREGSAEFRKEHVLPRWVEAVNAALRASQQLAEVDWSRTLAVGHSEGAIVAAHLAAANPHVTHLALLAGGGPTQLFDLVEQAGRSQLDDGPAAAEARVRQVYEEWAGVRTDPDNPDKLWRGHPHRRWSSFLKTSTLEGVLASRAAVFLAQGTVDRAVPVAGFDLLRAELNVRGRDVTAERFEGLDHAFRKPDAPPDNVDGFRDVLGRATDWFLKKSDPLGQVVKKELQRLEGTWEVVSLRIDGEPQSLEGAMRGLQVVMVGDQRTVKTSQGTLSQGPFRIDPAANPRTTDLVIAQGQRKGQVILGIYEIGEDTHKVCLAMNGGPRPTEFASKAESGHTLMVLRRVPRKDKPGSP